MRYGGAQIKRVADLESAFEKSLEPKDGKADQLERAIQLLDTAAELFEASGNVKQAEEITRLLEKLASPNVSK